MNYNLLQVWDMVSLYICSNERLSEHVIAPVPSAYANGESVRLRLAPLSLTRIAVDPYPFDQATLDIAVVHRRLPGNTFHDADEFQAAYFAAAPQVARFTLVDPAA